MEINGFLVDEYNVLGIPAKAKTSTCPKCSEHTNAHVQEKRTNKSL